MKEPKVHVGILFEPQIEFTLLAPYRAAAPSPLPERPRNLLELFKLHGNGASPPPIGPPPFPEDL